MKLIDKIKIRILIQELLNEKEHLRFTKSITNEHLFYTFFNGDKLFNYIMEYKQEKSLPLTEFNLNFDDEKLITTLVNSASELSEEDLFIKCNGKFLIRILFDNEYSDSIDLKDVVRKVGSHYLELLDILVEKKPEYIRFLSEKMIEEIRKNQDTVFERYKDKYYVFEVILLLLFKDKREIINICKKYNREFLLNNLLGDVGQSEIETISITSESKKTDGNELSEALKCLSNDFYNAYLDDNNKDQLKAVCDAFHDSLLVENETAIKIIRRLIEIKKENPDFRITFDSNLPNCVNPAKLTINFKKSESLEPVIVFHEFAHAIHYFNNKLAVQYDILNLVEMLRSDPSKIRESYERFRDEYLRKRFSIRLKLMQQIDDALKSTYAKRASEQVSILDGIDIEDEYKSQIMSLSNYERLYFDKQKQILIEEYVTDYFCINYPEIVELSDIFDSVFLGSPSSFSSLFGHGTDYYDSQKNCLCEIIADFVSIKCLPDAQKRLEYLRSFLGDELYYIIESGCNDSLGFDGSIGQKQI